MRNHMMRHESYQASKLQIIHMSTVRSRPYLDKSDVIWESAIPRSCGSEEEDVKLAEIGNVTWEYGGERGVSGRIDGWMSLVGMVLRA